MIAKTRKSTLAAATVVALTLTGLGVSAIAATSAQNNAATGYVVCVSKTTGDMKLRTASTCPRGFTTKVFGAKGPAGTNGAAGANGADGAQGAAGPEGAQGSQGEVGPVGELGPQGDIGEQGIQGDQGAPGLDGSAASLYAGFEGSQEQRLIPWSGVDADYKLAVTSKALPAGTYLVTATSSFRTVGGGPLDDAECWVAVDSFPLYEGGMRTLVSTYAGAPVALQSVVTIPEGGSTVSFGCQRQGSATNMTNLDTWITALKVGSVNP